jgi:hypothetical protein
MEPEEYKDSRCTTIEITSVQYSDFMVDYYKKKKEYPTYRVGQHFCNMFHMHNPELFYKRDFQDCLKYILENYVVD